ncbi:Rieske (2Fe-2S) protein [Aquimarina macrocephali]|uniref:Rieske (2Fe-2S) protein n=1 Tax=Aquimarina macrocephali TaxID=666563 RepID=UPI003F6694A6
MKKTLFLASVLLILSCSSDDNGDNNQFLPPSSVNYQINLNLPQFNKLKFPSNHFVDNSENGSIKGVIIYNIDNTQYSAFELSDPNHSPSSCSAQTIDGITSTCNCDDGNSYNIVTGQQTSGDGQFGLRRYRVRREGNTLFISN